MRACEFEEVSEGFTRFGTLFDIPERAADASCRGSFRKFLELETGRAERVSPVRFDWIVVFEGAESDDLPIRVRSLSLLLSTQGSDKVGIPSTCAYTTSTVARRSSI